MRNDLHIMRSFYEARVKYV